MANVVNLEKQREGRENALDVLLKLVGGDLDRVNEIIIERMHSPVALIPQLAGHIIAAGGKRLRPLLTLASARLCDYQGERQAKLAACVEFIHTATLLHDDVVDESLLRRGRDSANAVWGNKASVLVGDFLFSRSFELMVEDGSLKVLGILSHASSVIAEGEVAQLITANDTATTEDQYLDVIRAKTAQLFAAACQIGAVVADRPTPEEQALESYGMNLGIAFQLVDDFLDYSAKQQDLGKTVGDDFMDGKITLPVILAFRRGSDEDRTFLKRCLEDQDMPEPDKDLARAMELMRAHDTLTDTVNRARHYGNMARDALGIFPDGPAKGALTGIIDFCIERAY
ncbi:MAG: polyprenyl synthetase family protein [Rhodospirillum sp.]|nr:polyprenyl synthetase family protein [Rhodospirillum sp.]MCF8491747.1 polyprenyl synthetase family protein [Rhodospirillum sp.]MCF8502987.1 polyprenyl synthetase family protein [Rhodospirillum sp.]